MMAVDLSPHANGPYWSKHFASNSPELIICDLAGQSSLQHAFELRAQGLRGRCECRLRKVKLSHAPDTMPSNLRPCESQIAMLTSIASGRFSIAEIRMELYEFGITAITALRRYLFHSPKRLLRR